MFTWKDYLREKSMEELKEYRKKKIRTNILGALFMIIPSFLLGLVVGFPAVDHYGVEVAADMGACFGTGIWFMDILFGLAQLSVINDVIRDKKKKTIYDFYGVTE